MDRIKKLNRRLREAFGGKVSAREERGCTVLSGSLASWDDVVRAGEMAVDKRRSLGVVNDIRYTGGEIPPMRVPALTDSALEGRRPDVLVIGGGVVGCAIARELTRRKLDVILAEKEHDVALQASSRNDGQVHPGIDLLPGEVKRRYNLRGNRMYDRLCSELGVPFRRTGQYLCFKNESMRPVVRVGCLWWRALGVPATVVNRETLQISEPCLSPEIRFGVYFPTAGIVCPYGLTIALAENAADNGARIMLDTAVLGMEVRGGEIRSVATNRGRLYPRVVVNAAGVFAEEIAKMADDRFFSIHPRKGTNSILDKKATERSHLLVSSFGSNALKTKHSKGGGILPTVDGNVLVGPDAWETPEKENYATAAASVSATMDKQRGTDPELRNSDIITYFTGVRAPTYEEDFVICRGKFTRNIVHAAGIQSPGLTAAPAIAEDVAEMAVEALGGAEMNPKFQPRRTPIPRVAELDDERRAALIRQNPDYGEIVCRCEEVSRGEIIDALHRSVPCDTVDGVKRRVRPGMGRCQGGFCGPIVARIISEQTGLPLELVTKNGPGSELLLGSTKEALQ